MEMVKVQHKIKLGLPTNLLIVSLAGAIVLDASVKVLDYAEKKQLVKIGKGLEKIAEIIKEKGDKKSEEKPEE